MRSGMWVAPRQETAFTSPNRLSMHVAPVAEHVEDDAAAVALAVVPRRALRRDAPVALEHPVAELAAHREHAAEEAGVAQHRELLQARQEQLVLHRRRASGRSRGPSSPAPRRRRGRRRSASRSRCACRRRAPCDSSSARISVVPASKKIVSSGLASAASRSVRPARDAVLLRQRLHLVGVAADDDRVDLERACRRRASTPPWSRIARIERTRCWL